MKFRSVLSIMLAFVILASCCLLPANAAVCGDVNEDGAVFRQALGDCRGICRYGDITLPMDEALILVAVDVSGRAFLAYALDIPVQKVGMFDTELCEEFFRAFAMNANLTLHLRQLAGKNGHHIIEGAFKAAARCLRKAVSADERFAGEIPSTKGVL